MIGYTTTITDEGKVTITAASGNGLTGPTVPMHWFFANLKFNNNPSGGWVGAGADNCYFYNCEFSGNSNAGVSTDNTCRFVNCEAFNNGLGGFDTDSQGRFLGCISGLNTGHAYAINGSGMLYRCLGYATSTAGSAIYFEGGVCMILATTLDADNTCKVHAGDGGLIVICDSALYDAGAGKWGSEQVSPGTITGGALICYNLVNSNDAGNYESASTMPFTGYHDTTSAPGFEDEAGDDYTLGAGSAMIGAGIQPGGVT